MSRSNPTEQRDTAALSVLAWELGVPYAVIYTLSDPATKEVRYVGKTYDLSARLKGHLKDNKSSNRRSRWIASLIKNGKCPTIEPLENIYDHEEESWQRAERFWIETLRLYGCRLVNGDNGGRGGHQLSDEVRLRMSKAKSTPENRAAVSKRHRGKCVSKETRLKMSLANKGRKRTAEFRAGCSARNRLRGNRTSQFNDPKQGKLPM